MQGFHVQPDVRPLVALLRQSRPATSLTVYLEGDGAAWPRGRPPRDPTPDNPLALRLAMQDDGPLVAYLGRSCQYLDAEQLRDCSPDLWTGARFGDAAIAEANRAIDALLHLTGAKTVNLVGYSGGGTLAALVAARRSDVSCLTTVAAPLDIKAWAAHHGSTPLDRSYNPSDFSGKLSNTRQVHLFGGNDRIVPKDTNASYFRNSPSHQMNVLANYDHACCWAENWAALRRQTCLDK